MRDNLGGYRRWASLLNSTSGISSYILLWDIELGTVCRVDKRVKYLVSRNKMILFEPPFEIPSSSR